MGMGDELGRLADLHQRGALTDDEFTRAKAQVLGFGPQAAVPGLQTLNALRRSRHDRWLGGVCGGIARITGVQSWIWRLVFALLVLCAGTGALVYLLMWILVPEEPAVPALSQGQPQAG